MTIAITIPDFSRHGGIRVIVEWANRLSRHHAVTLVVLSGNTDVPGRWLTIADGVTCITKAAFSPSDYDCLILTSPHSSYLLDGQPLPRKTFLFLQMAEHLFRPADVVWLGQCQAFYTAPYPMFCISDWNIKLLRRDFDRQGECIYIGNGVNLDDFPIVQMQKTAHVVLVEGWEPGNPSKDAQRLGANAARELKRYHGCRILAYGALPLRYHQHIVDQYVQKPTTHQLNDLYQRATILLKCSKYDARSCAPVEAMTKGTVTVRAIIEGDDDLIDDVNAVRLPYLSHKDVAKACWALLNDVERLQRLQAACYEHVRRFTWDYWMNKVEQRIMQ